MGFDPAEHRGSSRHRVRHVVQLHQDLFQLSRPQGQDPFELALIAGGVVLQTLAVRGGLLGAGRGQQQPEEVQGRDGGISSFSRAESLYQSLPRPGQDVASLQRSHTDSSRFSAHGVNLDGVAASPFPDGL